MRPMFDVAIAGAGPAGAAAAMRLARAGFSVALIDERDFPRPKLCGEYLNLGAVRELRELGMECDLADVAVELRGMRLFAHDESASFTFSSPAWSISRTILDERLRSRAIDAGAKPVRARVRDLEDRGDRVDLTLERSEERFPLEARFVIAADGMRSNIARLLGATRPVRSARFATGGHYAVPAANEWVETYMRPEGYLAVNPLGPDSVNAVFVFDAAYFRQHAHDLRAELTRFSQRASFGAHTLHEADVLGRRYAIGPLAHATTSPVKGNVLLAGDAARFVDPFTGQGVYLALSAARLAARAITLAFERDASRAAFSGYARELGAMYRERERIALMMHVMLVSRSLSRRAARLLRRRPSDFAPLIDAVSARGRVSFPELALSLGKALR